MQDRQEQIAERRKQMPVLYRGGYDRAMRGRSLKSAVQAFCLECVAWQRKEVEKCTDVACPLFPYRPYQAVRWKARKITDGGNLGKRKAISEVDPTPAVFLDANAGGV